MQLLAYFYSPCYDHYLPHHTVCKGILDLHGASLVASSAGIGRGSCFTIEIPAEMAYDQNEPSGNNQRLASQTHNRCPPLIMRLITWPKSNVTSSESCKVTPKPTRIEVSADGVGCKITDSNNRTSRVDIEPRTPESPSAFVGDGDAQGGKSPRLTIPSSLENDISLSAIAAAKSIRLVTGRVPDRTTSTQGKPMYLRNRVLIVDDAPLNRKMMRRILLTRFNDVAEAEDGQQALDMVRASLSQGEYASYDVITMDYQMPVMDGVTATRRLRQIGYGGQIIAVTGNALGEDVHTFISSGADVVLTKPLTVAAFDEYLNSC